MWQHLPTPDSIRTEARVEGPKRVIKVHYFNNWTDSSEPTAPDDRKQHPLATGQAVKKCRNPVFPIIGCVPAVFLAQCSYPLQWIYPSPTTHLPRFLPVALTFTRFFELCCFLPGLSLFPSYSLTFVIDCAKLPTWTWRPTWAKKFFWTWFLRALVCSGVCTIFRFVWILKGTKIQAVWEDNQQIK